MSEIFERGYYPELCCEECGDVIHNHFDCPACNKMYAGTDIFGMIDEYEKTLTCSECHVTFEIISYDCDFVKLRKVG